MSLNNKFKNKIDEKCPKKILNFFFQGFFIYSNQAIFTIIFLNISDNF